ncbi:tRNA (adenosine(37)-N6)-dimethylallyltransferase MiaA [Streptococcus sp. sy004]|uniref:tRNA (adenosine(37)-N6)-dimethylallyltransferase MiaA n=1 Tax=Streptococcus sp. sy004 TaxID=2600149 RepID=UPI0011B78695|nr:tRNA (adenosine(37)-N6)-dimethylallyltransferase MiaA [Streptococcus sp. sy004]TWT10401.1 tRNA (adenosine(37)-N6)-dimethylallyltransferase MiaA [Streptococcus sp. sy004]
MKTKLIVIAGPTAVGKTALGIKLAQAFDGEIISGDSQQVYRQLDIGTAKASQTEQEEVVHHLIDVREVSETYSAFDFVQEAKEAIENISSRGKLPIIVGGTGLYLQSLLEGYHLGGQVNQEQVLAYRQELDRLSEEELFIKIAEQGIELEQINRRRAMRALELAKFGNHMTNQEPPYQALLLGLTDDRESLYQRINQRVDQMVELGLLDEARWLYDHFPEVQASRGIGYKELFPYFAGQMNLNEALDKLKQNTRRFAKRQLTWFRNRMSLEFYQIADPNMEMNIKQRVQTFLEQSD